MRFDYFIRGAFFAPLILLVSCATSDPNALRRMGETQYLEGLHVPGENPGPSAAALPDTFSYWEGGGSGPAKIVINLSEQAAYFYRGSHVVGRSKISTGSPGHETPTGSFKIDFKNPDHKSSLYGWILDAGGNIINDNADIRKDKPPPGGKFDPAKMTWFMRFYPAIGMHAGFLPGYPASHGCVRMPEWMAKKFFDNVSIGTPVVVTY